MRRPGWPPTGWRPRPVRRTVHYVPETPDDVGQQKVLVGEALASRPDAVVFVPTDDRAMVEDVRRFEAAGIPVVNCVNRMEGRVRQLRRLGRRGRGLQRGPRPDRGPGRQGRHRRHRGLGGARRRPATAPSVCSRALAEAPAVRVLGSGGGAFQVRAGAAGDGPAAGRSIRSIDGVWTGNDLMAFGALEALAEAGRSAKVVGINGLPGAIERIEQGTMLASVDFSAFNIAAIAARAALRHLAGEAVPKQIMIPAVLIDRTNHRAWQVPFAGAAADGVGRCRRRV